MNTQDQKKAIQSWRAKRVTIDDLAQHLNLSKGTVSRALNGYSDISEMTRIRVRKVADQMGYRPLSHAQAIRTGLVRSLGLVLQVNEHDGHRPFVADFLAGVSEAASAQNWTLTVSTAESDEDTLRLLEALADDQKADGFILPRTRLSDPRISFLRDQEIPFVLYGRTGDPTGCSWYDITSEDSMVEAVEMLAGLGHRRIGFVPGAPGYTYAKLRLEGYQRGLQLAGLPQDSSLITAPAVNIADGAKAAETLLDLDEPATAILYSVDRAAFGAYTVARDRGLHIGRDLSLISYDGLPEGSLIDPPLTTFQVDSRKAGKRLAELLIQQIRGADPEDLRELARARLLDRASHGPVPAPAGPNGIKDLNQDE